MEVQGRPVRPRPGRDLGVPRAPQLQGAPVPAGEGRIQETRGLGRTATLRGLHQTGH